jgi:hypothetical protein
VPQASNAQPSEGKEGDQDDSIKSNSEINNSSAKLHYDIPPTPPLMIAIGSKSSYSKLRFEYSAASDLFTQKDISKNFRNLKL